jgi:hypothetical protein
MCEHQGQKVPKDYALFPGKMDHSSVVACRVGLFPRAGNFKFSIVFLQFAPTL